MQIKHYLALLERSERELGDAYEELREQHADETDFFHVAHTVRQECASHSEQLKPFLDKYGEEADDEPERLHSDLFRGSRKGALGFLRDLHDLYLMVCECDITWTLLGQAAKGLRDEDLIAVVENCESETAIQKQWLQTRMKQAAPQTLTVS